MTDAIRRVLRRLLAWSRKGPAPAPWESVGSPSYREAIRALAIGYPVRAIRRAAWRGRCFLVLHHPARCHDSRIKGWAWLHRQDELHPPGRLIVRITTHELASWRYMDWWPVEVEDLAADDWECGYPVGEWRPAINGPDTF
jgi:hypothetical protein